jgi:glycosyltransferase involved in cell wall biosynthesis
MKILFVDQFSTMGGAQQCFADLLPAIQDRGWTVHAALPGEGSMTRLLSTTPIPCGPYRSGKKSFGDVVRFCTDVRMQAATVLRLLRENRYDLVYVNGPRVLTGAAIASRVPILFHAHNFLSSNAAAIAGMSARARGATVVACSDFVATPLSRYVPSDRLHVVTNGARDMGYRRRDFAGPLRIGIVGRIEPQKGQAELLCAARRLPEAHFKICGESADAGYFELVRELASGLKVELMGWHDDMASVYAELDLLVIPSEQEGLPRVMLEAFSAGVPVVAFESGGITEVMRDGENGFLVAGPRVEGLAECLQRLLRSTPARLRNVAKKAREDWEQYYDVMFYRQRMVELINETAGQR